MKILKLVLIAIVTVSIYSFNKIDKNDHQFIKKELTNTASCVTITYSSNIITEEGRERARSCFSLDKNVVFLGLISTNGNSETWTIFDKRLGKISNLSRTDLDGQLDPDDKCTKRGYGIVSHTFHYSSCLN